MEILLKDVRIIDKNSNWGTAPTDVLINENGRITDIRKIAPSPNAKVYRFNGAYLSIGWMDFGIHICDPGHEEVEDLLATSEAAELGGFTSIVVLPNTQPTIQTKSEVFYIKNQTASFLTKFFPLAAVSKDTKGHDLNELLDLHHSGAIGFTDGQIPLQNSGLLKRALQYVKAFDGIVIDAPFDPSINPDGQIHEGYTSTSLGLRGIPDIAEKLIVQRNISMAKYTNSKIHLSNISCAASVELIKQAKENGIKVTASTPYLNLVFQDNNLASFDPNLKVLPPLRSQKDTDALKDGLCDGTIDFITSNHYPLEMDDKKVEFTFASFGAIGLQTAVLKSWEVLSKQLTLEDFIEKWTIAPRRALQLEIPSIEIGNPAEFTIFNLDQNWMLGAEHLRSKARNSPFLGKQINGKVLAVINGSQSRIFNNQ